MSRIYNFSAGPSTLPEEVLLEAKEDLLNISGSGMSIMEHSHRGPIYTKVHEEAIYNIRKLLNLSDDYDVLFLQGGASMQFAMVPLNLLTCGKTADYINSGAWASKAIKEAKILGDVNIIADTSKESPARMPDPKEFNLSEDPAYVHITSNETISGVQYKDIPTFDAPVVADMSSDILSRPIDVKNFALIYAGAQKNLGPAGVTLVIIRKDIADRVSDKVPTIMRYSSHIKAHSLYNTAPTFSVYILMLVTRWIMRQGQDKLYKQNIEKAGKLYDFIDSTDFYKGTALKEYRSDMNVTFRLPTEELESKFVAEALDAGMSGLKGHRSVGGIRASIYNAFPVKGIESLIAFMRDFEIKNG